MPLYAQTRDDLLGRIRAGEWSHDDPLPSEAELARHYGISVGTMRRVLGSLTADGVIERRQGSGTFVRRAAFRQSLARFFRAGDRMPASRILVRERIAPPTEVATALGSSNDVLHLLRLRTLDDDPYLIEDIWLPLPEFSPVQSVGIDELGDLLYPTYERLTGLVVASATEDLSVVIAESVHAQLLACPVGAPLVRVERIARSVTGQILEHRVSRGVASRFHYRVEIS
jgi:GntR family transcriptional regulator